MEEFLVATDPEAFLPTLASAVHNLGLIWQRSGCLEQSLECAVRAVGLYSELCERNHAAYGRGHATAMNTLAVRLAQHGEFQKALQVSRVCCGLVETLYEENEQLWRSEFATALQTYSNRLAGVGQLEESLIQAERVVELRRAACESEPGNPRLRQDLADSLSNLSLRLEQNGNTEAAIHATEEAEGVKRSLIQSDVAKEASV